MKDFPVFVVDDDEMALAMMRAMLEPEYSVETFTGARDCAARIAEAPPGMLLLDVGLPGLDGYSFCRQLKDDGDTRHLPVVFVSAHDTLEDRLAGFDAGGEDFIVKPVEPELLLRKVQVAERCRVEQCALRAQVVDAQHVSLLAMSSMGDSGVALQFMSRLVGWESEQEIAAGLLELMAHFDLAGVVETRVGARRHVRGANGVDQPRDAAILGHLRGMGRIFEFRNRGVYNLEHLTLMVANMPTGDPERCGRIRDTLAIVTDGANGRLQALDHAEARERTRHGLMQAVASLRRTIDEFTATHARHRLRSSEILFQAEQNLARSFVHLGLSEQQERHVEELFRSAMAELVEFVEQGGAGLQASLAWLQEELGSISARE